MGKALIIGAGGVANVVIHKCCQNPDVFEEILIASRTLAKCDAIRDTVLPWTKTRVRTARLDADQVGETVALIREFQPDIVINVALPYQDLAIMDACLATRTHYIDTANYEPRDVAKFEYKWQWAYRERFEQAGITAVLGSGFDPGVSGIFCAYALKHHFDEIHEIDILDANAGDHGYPFATNFNPEINIREITAKGSYIQDGTWIETEPLEIRRVYDFPQIGPKDIYLLHHEELESLAVHIPGVRRIRFWMTFSERYITHLKVLENVGMTSIVPIDFNGIQIAPLEFLKAVLPDPSSLGPRTKGKTNIGCLIRGVKDGKPRDYYVYNVCDHEAAYAEVGSQAISYTTGVPAMIGAMMVLTGQWLRPGVHNVEEFDPDPFMEQLNRQGLPWVEDFSLRRWIEGHMDDIDFTALDCPTPCYVVDERLLRRNLDILGSVQDRTGCKILLALKGFAMYAAFPLIGGTLAGVTASSLFEARLGREEMDKEVHIYSPAYAEAEFDDILRLCDHIVFNSFAQWIRYRDRVRTFTGHPVGCGIRVNPEYSEITTALYDPCAPFSRLGVTLAHFRPEELDGIEGLHFHTMCEQNSDTLERTARVVDEKFGPWIARMKWINLGGGHHITRPDYDLDALVRTIRFFQEKYGVAVYLEPGEAIALNTGYLVARVLDIVDNGMPIALLDASAACHMPDVLEMPYRPGVIGSGLPGEKTYTYRLGSTTCLAGDIIGDYSFDQPLREGSLLVFQDMAHYTMVKNNMFNGVNLPAIAMYSEPQGLRVIRRFGYEDYRGRLS